MPPTCSALHVPSCDSVEDLEKWISFRLDEKRRAGQPVEHFHTTRMVPTRVPELVDGGSLYWVIKRAMCSAGSG